MSLIVVKVLVAGTQITEYETKLIKFLEILVLTIRVIVTNGLLILKLHIRWILVIYS
jgi:hypothetical protein